MATSHQKLKRCYLDIIIPEFANKQLKDDVKPEQWSEMGLQFWAAVASLSDTGNYKEISLSAIVTKMVNKMILNRIQPKVDKQLQLKWIQIRTVNILHCLSLLED